ncbi:histidinol-phosphate transaminase [Helicobacter cappadocius]|uniref:Histidinol-phosphate aminotransferase n=1 Tax=Helicobacter cappadocius TaxID=3063998 RepID=A0AA90SSX2_9HELI|nr:MULTISPECIES: histidinol-phosphate transaminase [unclassified Helicobacter]MDO7253477.1 histidinol-phosphate transaminase [Helicobacter sp. faydin-H75]MDP2539404.1 histidinol-phosphate transaminase [Helicobacter sp. faydin-H76]
MNFNQELDDIVNYEAGKPVELLVREFGIKPEDVIKLGSNENPFGYSPKVNDAIISGAKKASFYPDDSMFELKDAIAHKYNIKSNNIIIGAGSDQVIEFCIRAKCRPNTKVLMAKVTFAMYEIYAKQVGAKVIKTSSNHHDVNEFSSLYDEHKPEVVFLCVPNNPLGECLDKDAVFNLISQTSKETLVVIDGAYQEFAKSKDKNKAIEPKELLEKFENVIYLGTFSKAYGLGGMRIGYGLAHPEIIKALSKLRPPFNIGILSLDAAHEAIKDQVFVQSSVSAVLKEMLRYEAFAIENSIEFIPSWGNFITFVLEEKYSSTQVCDWLLKKGVIIRNLKSYGINAIRITIGRADQNNRVLELLQEFFSSKHKL